MIYILDIDDKNVIICWASKIIELDTILCEKLIESCGSSLLAAFSLEDVSMV